MASRYAAEENPEALRAIANATAQLNIRDISHMAQYRGSAMEEPEAVVFHHTAGRGTPEGVVNTLNNRVDPFTGRKMILGVHYIIDRDGSVHAALPPGTTGAHVLTNQERNLGNQNTIGVEVIAKDNDDVTPEQVAAGKLLHAYLSSGRKKPLDVFGHGELNPGHKLPNEGLAVVNPIRNRFKVDAARGYAEGGEVDCGCDNGYAKGGLKEVDDLSQWLQLGGQDMESSPEGLPVGQFVGSSVAVPAGAGVADAFKLAHQAYEGELPEDYFRSDEGSSRMLNAAMTPMLGSFGLSHAVGPALKEGETLLGMAVKPKGGNWIKGSIENQTKGLKSGTPLEDLLAANEHWALEASDPVKYPQQAANANRYIQSNNQDIAIDNWVDKKLNKYIRNEMATPEDPIRLLAEKDILHVDPEKNLYPTWRHIPNQENLAQSFAAKTWEDVSDRALTTDPAKDYQKQNWFSKSKQGDNPWLEKLDPETPVYEVNELSPMRASLGFNHLVDELKNAVRHDSDLPTHLRLTPEKLEKVSVPQAVELVSKINKWREEAAANALAKNATNDAVHLVKEYPEAGYKWVELKPPTAVSEEVLSSLSAKERELFNHYVEAGDTPYEALQGVTGTYDNPALAAALKYEGDMMGHCVGGYCSDVESGQSRIFSLRDSKGRPHVTIETGRNPMYEGVGNAINKIEPGLWEKMVEQGGHYDHNKWLRENRPDVHAELNKENVIQVKGKGNMKPKDEYIPFVQDFVRSREWGKIGDSRNIDMARITKPVKVGDNLEVPPGYYTQNDVKNLLAEKGLSEQIPWDLLYSKLRHYDSEFARGGSVQDSGATEAADLNTLFQKYADPGYAMGGSVSPQAMANDNLVYNPDEIDAIAAQIRGVN
jgi:hypothetical protein